MDLHSYYRQKRRISVLRRAFFIFLTFLVFCSVVWGFFWAPFLRVIEIEVVDYPDTTSVRNIAGQYLSSLNYLFLPNNHFLLVSEEKIENLLRENGFESINVEKGFPKKLVVRFLTPQPWLIYCKNNTECFYVDHEGFLSNAAPNFSQKPMPELMINFKTLGLGDSAFDGQTLIFLQDFFSGLAGIDAYPAKVELLEGRDLIIFLKEGWILKLSSYIPSSKLLADLQLLLSEKIKDQRNQLEYVDLRFENKAFYKLR